MVVRTQQSVKHHLLDRNRQRCHPPLPQLANVLDQRVNYHRARRSLLIDNVLAYNARKRALMALITKRFIGCVRYGDFVKLILLNVFTFLFSNVYYVLKDQRLIVSYTVNLEFFSIATWKKIENLKKNWFNILKADGSSHLKKVYYDMLYYYQVNPQNVSWKSQ